jgi:hypothetical protein
MAMKKAARGQKTGERYEKPIKDFLAHMGQRANPLMSSMSEDVVFMRF